MKKTFLFLLCISLASTGAWAAKGKLKTARQITAEDQALVQCIKEKGITMYGTAWCPHCKEQKAEFGNLFSELSYVDCDENPKGCKEKKVTGYPTWLTPEGKEIQPGSIKEIAVDAGCNLSQIKEASMKNPMQMEESSSSVVQVENNMQMESSSKPTTVTTTQKKMVKNNKKKMMMKRIEE